MKYGVFDNGKPAIIEASAKGWNHYKFDTFGSALAYAKEWLGDYDNLPDDFAADTSYDYSGYGDMIEIRTLEDV